MNDIFRRDFNDLFANLKLHGSGEVDGEALRRLFFGDYLSSKSGGPRLYREIKEPEAIISEVERKLKEYNSATKKPMPLVLFLFAVEHISRICRVLKMPGGHALLVGVGGSGRRSLSRLATHMMGYEFFTVEVNKSYDVSEWKDDLKALLLGTGCEQKQYAFLFDDTQVITRKICLLTFLFSSFSPPVTLLN